MRLTCGSHLFAPGSWLTGSSVLHSSFYSIFWFTMKTTNTYRFLIFSPNQVVLFYNFLGKVYLAHGDHCIMLFEFHLVPCYKILLIFFTDLLLSNEVVFWQCAFVSKHTLHLPAYRISMIPSKICSHAKKNLNIV
jgi:hypothetical protein